MELRHLRYFLAVAEAGSLTAAAERLHVAQPALTQTIKALEEELETRLFERSKKGMELSDSGHLFLSHAQTIMRQVTTAKNSIRDATDNPQGMVSIALPASVSHAITVSLFKTVNTRYPNIELALHEGLSGDLELRFRQGLDDIMVNFDLEGEPAGWNVEPLLRESLYFVERRRRGCSDEAIAFARLSEHPLFLPRTTIDSMGRALNRYANTANLELQVLRGAPTMHGTILLVQGGLGYTVLPWSAVYDLAGRTLNARRVVEPELYRTVYLITDSSRARSKATEKVLDVIRDTVRRAHADGLWHGELLLPS